jgi:hypothetical protein
VYDVYAATGAHTGDDTLFELLLERALHAKYGPRPSCPPRSTPGGAPGAEDAPPKSGAAPRRG